MAWDALTASDEVKAADWIRDRLHPFAQYVDGSNKLIEEIVANPVLEALAATTSQGMTAYSDPINS